VRIPARTPQSFADALARLDAAPPVEITGLLSLPARVDGPLPLVLVAIGSLGMTSGREELYAEAIVGAGMAAMVVDGNTPRGVKDTVASQGAMPWPACTTDPLFALRQVRNDPRFDPERIALLGYSRGGFVAVMADDERLQAAVVGAGPRLAAHVALYPPCYMRWRSPHPTKAPLLMILGGRDDLAPAEQGRAYAAQLERAGGAVEIVLFPEACHSFDADFPARTVATDNWAVRDIIVDDAGEMLETRTGIRAGSDWPGFLAQLERAPGGRNGGSSGNGPLPRDVAVAPILAFLRKTLHLEA
jgi:dienelactone hydrolase